MTAHASLKEAENAIKRGMNDYIFKPFDAEVLHQKILQYTTKAELIANNNKTETPITTENLIDLKFLREETFDDRDILETILNSFLDDFEDFINKCEVEIENQNWEQVYALTHKIATYGISNRNLWHQNRNLCLKPQKKEPKLLFSY